MSFDLVAQNITGNVHRLIEMVYEYASRLDRNIKVDFRGSRQVIGDHTWRLPETIYVSPNDTLQEIKDALGLLYRIGENEEIIYDKEGTN